MFDAEDYGADVAIVRGQGRLNMVSAAGLRDEVADWLSAGFGSIPWSMHYITNIDCDIHPGGDTATVRAMFYNPMHFAGDNAGYFDCGGWYNHELVRTDDGWKSRKLWEDFSWTTMGK